MITPSAGDSMFLDPPLMIEESRPEYVRISSKPAPTLTIHRGVPPPEPRLQFDPRPLTSGVATISDPVGAFLGSVELVMVLV